MLRVITLLLVVTGLASAQRRLVTHVYDPAKTRSEIRVTALFSEVPPSGCMPVRVYIRNASPVPRTWTLRFVSSDSSWTGGNEMRSTFSAFCEAGQTSIYEFLPPLVTAFQAGFNPSTSLTVNVSAPALGPLNGSMSTTYDPAWPSVAMGSGLHTANSSKLDAQLRSPHGSGSGGKHMASASSNAVFGGGFEAAELSEDWRAYSGIDTILISEDDWSSANPGARNAILRWNRMGGKLLVYAVSRTTDLSSLGIVPGARGTREANRSWGRVEVLPMSADTALDPGATMTLVGKTLPKASGTHTLSALRDDFESNWPLQTAFGSKTTHFVFFILILVAFGILVGPVNLFVFAKAGQRHRLFVTTPIISVAASLFLVVLIVFQDGFGGRGQRLMLVEVRPDNGENTAYLCQEQIVRTGVLLSSGFATNEVAYVSPVLIADSSWARVTAGNSGGRGRYTTEILDRGLQMAGDWFQSRSEHGHYIQTTRPTRGRIELISSNPPEVTSTFEFPLGTLFFTSDDGEHWRADDVQQGRRTTLVSSPKPQFEAWLKSQKSAFSARNRKRLDMTAPRRGHFVASSTGVPAVETLDAIRWEPTRAVISGPIVNP